MVYKKESVVEEDEIPIFPGLALFRPKKSETAEVVLLVVDEAKGPFWMILRRMNCREKIMVATTRARRMKNCFVVARWDDTRVIPAEKKR